VRYCVIGTREPRVRKPAKRTLSAESWSREGLLPPLVFQPRAAGGGELLSGIALFFSRPRAPSRTCTHFSESIIPPLSARDSVGEARAVQFRGPPRPETTTEALDFVVGA